MCASGWPRGSTMRRCCRDHKRAVRSPSPCLAATRWHDRGGEGSSAEALRGAPRGRKSRRGRRASVVRLGDTMAARQSAREPRSQSQRDWVAASDESQVANVHRSVRCRQSYTCKFCGFDLGANPSIPHWRYTVRAFACSSCFVRGRYRCAPSDIRDCWVPHAWSDLEPTRAVCTFVATSTAAAVCSQV